MFTVKRSEENPLLSPRRQHPWEAAATFNWCPVKDGRLTYVAYRAMSEKELLEEPKIHHSIIARAQSKDGSNFTDRAPFIVPEHDFERYGCEDPRVTKLDDKYYIFYTALSEYPFNANGIKVALAISSDMKTVDEKHLVTPFNAKAMALFPKKINGKYVAILTVNTDNPPAQIAIAEFEKIEDIYSQKWWEDWYNDLGSHIIQLARSDDDQVELGSPPIYTKDGWLITYSHISHYHSDKRTFGIEAVLLDKKNPRLIVGRTKGAFLVPETYYEETGLVPGIVFPSGALIAGDDLEIYYGASDTHCAKASVNLENLIESMKPGSTEIFTRFPGNPIISPRPDKDWEAHGTFNPAAIDLNKTVHILYRAMSKDDTSTFGYAASKNGLVIDARSEEPTYEPREEFEKNPNPGFSGCEDPRMVKIGSDVVMTYTGYNGSVPRVVVTKISESDFLAQRWKKWSKPVAITPPNLPNKDACIVPEKGSDGYVVIHRVEESICADIFESLDFSSEHVHRCIEIISPRRGMWDGQKVGIAGPPLKTRDGWLLLYHGVSETSTYRVGATLLSLKDPTVVIARSATPIFEPKTDYEMKGMVPKVVFPCGMVRRGQKIYLYYGGADQVVGVATATFSDIMKTLK
jgi:predicted GH43/DUF377 family glycosyl hydrolase